MLWQAHHRHSYIAHIHLLLVPQINRRVNPVYPASRLLPFPTTGTQLIYTYSQVLASTVVPKSIGGCILCHSVSWPCLDLCIVASRLFPSYILIWLIYAHSSQWVPNPPSMIGATMIYWVTWHWYPTAPTLDIIHPLPLCPTLSFFFSFLASTNCALHYFVPTTPSHLSLPLLTPTTSHDIRRSIWTLRHLHKIDYIST